MKELEQSFSHLRILNYCLLHGPKHVLDEEPMRTKYIEVYLLGKAGSAC